MYKSILIFLFLLVGTMAKATNLDSLLQVLAKSKEDTAQVRLLRTIAWKYVLINADSSQLFYRKSLSLAELIHFPEGQIFALMGLQAGFGREGQKDSSLLYLRKALSLAKTLDHPKLLAVCYGQFGSFYTNDIYKPDSAIYYFDLALQIQRQANATYDQWHNYLGRGEMYYKLGMDEKGEADVLEALRITETRKIRMDYGVVLYRLIRNYFDLGEWDKYSKWSEAYIRFIEQGDQHRDRLSAFHRGLYFFEDESNAAQVIPVLQHIVDIHQKNKNAHATLDALQYLASVEWKAGKKADAIQTLERAIAAAPSKEFLIYQEIFYERISKWYEETGHLDKAYFNFKKYKTVHDSVEVMDNRNHIAELEVRFETAKKEEELTRQSLELEKKKSINRNFFWLSAMLSLLVIGGGAFLWLKIKSNRSLAIKNNIILSSLEEKELLLNEIHHRVKNNLQVISSLLNLQSKYIEDPSALEAIKEGRNRVNSMSLIHQHLYGRENLSKIDVGLYLEKLSDSLFQSYNINRDRVHLITEVDSIMLDIDILIPLGLILNELISNALKHAFPNNREGNVRVVIKRQEANIVLEVNDNGVGASNHAGDDSNDSFGMDMIKAFAQKLKATLEIKYQPGVSARLVIPNLSA